MKLSFKRLDLQLVHPWAISRGEKTSQTSVVVVQLHKGATGIGEASPIGRYGESPQTVEAFLNKLDANYLSFDDVPESMEYINGISEGSTATKCAINVALLDGAAKQRQLSLHDYLGLKFQERKHTTSFTIGIDNVNVIRQKAELAAHYPIYKVKVGVFNDYDNLRALREIAPKKLLRLDVNEAWKTKETAIKNIERLAKDGYIQFIEQPMSSTTPIADWVWLKERSALPIFADESYHQASDAERCAECFHGVNVKLVKAGGITGAMEALQAARKFGLKTMIGCMIESSILISAAAHLAELCDYVDLDGNLLITNDPYLGVTAENGILSFANTREKFGLQVCER